MAAGIGQIRFCQEACFPFLVGLVRGPSLRKRDPDLLTRREPIGGVEWVCLQDARPLPAVPIIIQSEQGERVAALNPMDRLGRRGKNRTGSGSLSREWRCCNEQGKPGEERGAVPYRSTTQGPCSGSLASCDALIHSYDHRISLFGTGLQRRWWSCRYRVATYVPGVPIGKTW